VFDAPLDGRTAAVAGGNLTIHEATRRGRDAADHLIVELAETGASDHVADRDIVVTSDRGLRDRLPGSVAVIGAGRFRALIGY